MGPIPKSWNIPGYLDSAHPKRAPNLKNLTNLGLPGCHPPKKKTPPAHWLPKGWNLTQRDPQNEAVFFGLSDVFGPGRLLFGFFFPQVKGALSLTKQNLTILDVLFYFGVLAAWLASTTCKNLLSIHDSCLVAEQLFGIHGRLNTPYMIAVHLL